MGADCWDNGCNFADSLAACEENGGTLAKIGNARDNRLIGKLLRKFGKFKPDCGGDFFWFYNGLRDWGDDNYYWDHDYSTANFTNW